MFVAIERLNGCCNEMYRAAVAPLSIYKDDRHNHRNMKTETKVTRQRLVSKQNIQGVCKIYVCKL